MTLRSFKLIEFGTNWPGYMTS